MTKKKDSKKKPELLKTEERRLYLRDQLYYIFPFYAVEKIVPWIGLIVLAYVAIYLPVKQLAGKDTSFISDFALNVGIDRWICWIACVIFGGGWYLERRSRQNMVKRHAQRVKQLEKIINPNRGTSGLSEYGTAPSGEEGE